jgi:SAM-dependent methyltransferase
MIDAHEEDHETGSGVITRDGCAVEVYARLPAGEEPALIHAVIPQGASILDLGCGTGRLAMPLVALGHPVIAVDESADMLAHVVGAATVCGRIESLDLGQTFDAVVLASHLLNTPNDQTRHALLRTCRHHTAPTGQALIQWHPPEWFATLTAGTSLHGAIGPMLTRLDVISVTGDILVATVTYRDGDLRWTHRFTARQLTDAQLHTDLERCDLTFQTWLTGDHSWLIARPTN